MATTTKSLARKGARTVATVDPKVLKQLEAGNFESVSLTEGLAINMSEHCSDTVRGWAAFAVGQDESMTANARLLAIKPFAADKHFGVREWAWDKDANIRRFSSEATRPRGVWAASIPLLRKEPQHALPILDALKLDQDRYVEDSVANWLNDAAKDQADWVRSLLEEWQKNGASERLIKRASRSLK